MTEKTVTADLEKGFNDDELADIMNEIESLEKEFVEETPVTVAKVEVPEEEIVSELKVDVEEVATKKTNLQAEIDNEFENLLSSTQKIEVVEPVAAIEPKIEIKETPVEMIKETHKEEVMNNVVSLKEVRAETVETKTTPKTENQTQLDFSVAGQMNLKLNFTVGGQTISLCVNETDGMVIEMMGGARFILPMAEVAAKKKAA